jgi:hypothetical protein
MAKIYALTDRGFTVLQYEPKQDRMDLIVRDVELQLPGLRSFERFAGEIGAKIDTESLPAACLLAHAAGNMFRWVAVRVPSSAPKKFVVIISSGEDQCPQVGDLID